MDSMIQLILNSSVSVAVIAYFMYRDNKFMTELQNTLTTLVDTINVLKDLIQKNDDVRALEQKGE